MKKTSFIKTAIQDKKDIGVFAGFKLHKGEQLLIKTGTSFSSLEGAKKNLEKEIGTKSFEEVQSEADSCMGGCTFKDHR